MPDLARIVPGLKVKERAAKATPVVHQVKILKDAAKPGAEAATAAAAKSPKGKGFAFVELTEHEHALCALRQLNNNPVPFGARLATSASCWLIDVAALCLVSLPWLFE